jgi:SAM-dependent methyltransferase
MADRQQLSAIGHTWHPIAAPLSDASVARVLARAIGPRRTRLLDLGCATGEWLVRAATSYPQVTGLGIDVDEGAVARGNESIRRSGLGDRLELRVGDAREVSLEQLADCVLSVGAAHAFGGLLPTLHSVRRHLGVAATVVVGDGFWETEPTEATLAVGFERDEYADLATTVERVVAAGWAPVYGHVSTTEEWDDYEWSWTGAVTEWALDNDDAGARGAAAQHRQQWLGGYRDTLGFVTLVLRAVDPSSVT